MVLKFKDVSHEARQSLTSLGLLGSERADLLGVTIADGNNHKTLAANHNSRRRSSRKTCWAARLTKKG